MAGRYLFSKGEPRFSFFLTTVAVAGIAVGVAALIVVLSVMTGFTSHLEKRLRGFNPEVTVFTDLAPDGTVAKKMKENFPEIISVDSIITGEVILKTNSEANETAVGAKVVGLTNIPERMRETAVFYWSDEAFGNAWWHHYISPLDGGVVLGSELIYQTAYSPDFGGKVLLISPFGGIDPMGNPAPVKREYTLLGAFKSGLFEYDMKYILMPYGEASRLLRSQGRHSYAVSVKEGADIPRLIGRLKNLLGEKYTVSGWDEKNRRLFAALSLERRAMSFLLGLIIVIASFSIAGVTMMIFFGKRRDLAIMMSMGARKKSVAAIFITHGALIGLVGSFLGTVIGLILCLVVWQSHIPLPPSYYLDYLPVKVGPLQIMVIFLGGVLISIAASFYPARRSLTVDPVKLLRYE